MNRAQIAEHIAFTKAHVGYRPDKRLKFKEGMEVVITDGCDCYYLTGHRCRLAFRDLDGDWWGDFNGFEDQPVMGFGLWCLGKTAFRVLA